MTDALVDVDTMADGTLVIHPRGMFEASDAVDLRRILVQAIRHHRPLRLVLDLSEVRGLDSINLGTLAGACHLGDDHRVAVFLDHPSPTLADELVAAGIPAHRLRRVGEKPSIRPQAALS
ncbi:STAS domain-containing protein [Paractinoplanes maris]|uniref:STAS domain-containing protein n=1 Tax=Paractinoplanes maris TaxID=1734446 RepID=UPI0020224AC8|nr:STAS domain-containing protein [Actinoplanes maris]